MKLNDFLKIQHYTGKLISMYTIQAPSDPHVTSGLKQAIYLIYEVNLGSSTIITSNKQAIIITNLQKGGSQSFSSYFYYGSIIESDFPMSLFQFPKSSSVQGDQ